MPLRGFVLAAYDPTYQVYVLTFSPLIEGYVEGLDVFRFFFKQLYYV